MNLGISPGIAQVETLGAVTRTLEQDRVLVNRWLAKSLSFEPRVPRRLAEAMRYAVLGPGKRIRPILALEAFRAVLENGVELGPGRMVQKARSRKEHWVAPFCCGIEMIHAFSLVHDDLPSMDNDDFRRGRPSLHRRFDEATAILAADALLARAFELFVTGTAPADRRLAAAAELARAIGPAGMAGGQMMDVVSLRVPGIGPSTQESRKMRRSRAYDLIHIASLKTAEFMAASLVAGAIVAGASGLLVSRLRQAGRVLGRLFQVTDDLLDDIRESERERRSARMLALALAREAERRFDSLGPRFSWLRAITWLVLHRKR
ncbi:MAG: polyprenyl synthetase family protein [candidate division WOR-3 bacterium]